MTQYHPDEKPCGAALSPWVFSNCLACEVTLGRIAGLAFVQLPLIPTQPYLPRLWLKSSLNAAGKLHPDYPFCGHGYDQMTLDALGIKKDDFVAFINDKRPSYTQLESWVAAYPGVNLTKANLYKHNASIMGYIHGDDVRKTILDAAGVTDESSVNPGAVDLNNIDDWTIFWSTELK